MTPPVLWAIVLTVFVVVLGQRPERRPGNLTPIQLISAVGTWALLLANAAAMAIAIRDGSWILLGAVTVTIAMAMTAFLDNGVVGIPRRQLPESVSSVIDDLSRLIGGAPRLGMDVLEAVVVDGRCPGIGVTVASRGRVIVRVRRDVVQWLEGHQQAGGAGAALVASFVQFTVLHEIGHVLNGDHRTFRFVRSVLVAHFAWIAGLFLSVVSLVVDPGASVIPLVMSTSIVVMFVAQSLVARSFMTERERLADWRAMQTLSPEDAARLLERRGRRRGVPNPTELEKLMIDLKTQASPRGRRGLFARLIPLVWPDTEDIHDRAEMAGGHRADADPKPVRWAALLGMQCGMVTMALILAAMFATAPWIGWRNDAFETLTLVIPLWVCAPAAAFCALRTQPARASVRENKRTALRVLVSVVFFLAFAAAATVLYWFQLGLRVPSTPPTLHFVVMLAVVAAIVGLCSWTAGLVGSSDGGGGLRDTPRAPWVQMAPVLASFPLLLMPLSIGISDWLSIGSLESGHWFPLMTVAFAMFTVSTCMARSTSAVLRAVAPMALLDTPAPVYGFRVFWRNIYIDLSRVTLRRGIALAAAVQLVAVPFFVIVAGVVMQRTRAVLSADATYSVFFFGTFAVMALILVIPDRYGVFPDPRERLLDGNRLQMFEKLLTATRTVSSSAADRLQSALSAWMRNDRFPEAVLPDPQSVWRLGPLSSLVRLARVTGNGALLERWRDRIASSLRQIIADDVVAIAPGQLPSMYWTTLATTIVDEAGLERRFPLGRMLDRIEMLLAERLTHGTANLLGDVVAASRLLRRHGRPGPDAQSVQRFSRSSSLASRPLLRQSLAELCELADLTNDADERKKLRPIVRSRSWEVLQLNPRKDVMLLLDCYLAAACLGEVDPRQDAARPLIEELAQRVSGELMAVVNA